VPTSSLPSGFSRIFLHLFLPAAIQNLFYNLIGIFDVLMIGQLGDVSVSAVGLAGQFFYLLNLTLFGTSSGAAVFAAQYWGAQDQANLRRVLGLCLGIGLSASAAFAVGALVFPRAVMLLFTHDPAVIALGAAYLRIIGWSYVFTAITVSFAAMLRSTGNTRLPMLVSVSMMCLNTALDYALIFGKAGLPSLGTQGAALGTTISRILESLILLAILYHQRSPVAARPSELFHLDLAFAARHLRLIGMVFLNEFCWALGVNVYNAILSRLGTAAYAGYSITTTYQNLGLFFASGCATTCSILVGQAIGARRNEQAFAIARRILFVSVGGSALIGLALVAARGPLMDLYRVSAEAQASAAGMLLVAGVSLGLRSLDVMFIVGILRSGGDTRFSAVIDVGAIWLAGIPVVALAAFVLRLPVAWVFAAMLTENLVKNAIGIWRFHSRRWIRDLAHDPMPA
jgi:putative MATE family efflux protein